MPDARTPPTLSPAEALRALEDLIAGSTDLADLEAAIGRFNIFDALGITRAEIRHSNFLAWLLDPAETHGQGQLFLCALLMDILRRTPAAGHHKRPMSPVDLDGQDLGNVTVRRSLRNTYPHRRSIRLIIGTRRRRPPINQSAAVKVATAYDRIVLCHAVCI